jgi:succinate dehydrogenase / fumarate reductase flavoprotein subunit
MGGIPTDIDCQVLADGKAKKVAGFYAAGECACVSVHGANRLGTNSLLEASLFGRRAGKSIVRFLRTEPALPDLPADAAKEAIEEIDGILSAPGSEKTGAIRAEMQQQMTANCAVYRNGCNLEQLRAEVASLRERYGRIRIDDKGKTFNMDLIDALELGRMLDVTEIMVASALNRTESRGGHSRTDFPKRDDANWLKHTLAHRKNGAVAFDYKPVVITRFQPQERKY